MYPRLWTLEAETAAAQHRQEIAEGKRSDDLTTDIPYRDGKDKPYLWEGYFYRILYGVVSKRGGCLQPFNILSGNDDPKVLRMGQSPSPPAHTRSIQPPAVLIESIDGTTLADYQRY